MSWHSIRPNRGASSPFRFRIMPNNATWVRDVTGTWSLLAFRSDPPTKEEAGDFVDVHAVQFSPAFNIAEKHEAVHVFFNHGATSFASTGPAYVEKSGRLLISRS